MKPGRKRQGQTYTCPCCGNDFYRLPSKSSSINKHCSRECQKNEKFLWFGWLFQNCRTMVASEAAEHIGVPVKTMQGWLPKMNSAVPKNYRIDFTKNFPRPPKQPRPKVQREPKPKPPKKPKEPKRSHHPTKPAKVINRLPDRVITVPLKAVRVNSRTQVLVPVTEPNDKVIERFNKRHIA